MTGYYYSPGRRYSSRRRARSGMRLVLVLVLLLHVTTTAAATSRGSAFCSSPHHNRHLQTNFYCQLLQSPPPQQQQQYLVVARRPPHSTGWTTTKTGVSRRNALPNNHPRHSTYETDTSSFTNSTATDSSMLSGSAFSAAAVVAFSASSMAVLFRDRSTTPTSSLDARTPISVAATTIAAPLQAALDDATNGWALSCANLAPETPSTTAGTAFLATNAAYFVVGLYLFLVSGDVWLGFWTDVCSVASFNYHYHQLLLSSNNNGLSSSTPATSSSSSSSFSGRESVAVASTTTTFNSNNNIQETDPVRLALLLDYVAAAISMSTAAAYLALSSPIVGGSSSWVDADAVLPALGVSALGLAFLGLSWRYERGRPYMVFHSAWHFCSAYAGLLIGTLHASTAAAVAVAVPSVHAFAAVVVATAGGGV